MAPLLFLVLTTLPLAISQSTTNSTAPPPLEFTVKVNAGAAAIVVVVVIATFLITLFIGYIRAYYSQSNSNIPIETVRRAPPATKGLGKPAIDALPEVLYSDVKDHKIGKGGLECAVCLCEFDDNETLKLLPRCDHVFHSDCIGTWLSGHVTCPVCRFDLAAGLDEPPSSPDVNPTAVDRTSNEVAIPVESSTQREIPVEFARMRSRTVLGVGALRSRSDLVEQQYWAEEETERFTLRLPEDVRREIMSGGLRRSASVEVPITRQRSNFQGYIDAGHGRRSVKWGDRWSFVARAFSFKGREGAEKRGEGGAGPSRLRNGDGDGGGVSSNCLGRGGGERSDDERSTVAFAQT